MTNEVIKVAKVLRRAGGGRDRRAAAPGQRRGAGEQEHRRPRAWCSEFLALCQPDTLAIGIGNAHGYYKGKPDIHLDVLENVRKFTDIPLVLHGCTGMDEQRRQGRHQAWASPRSTSAPRSATSTSSTTRKPWNNLDHQGHSWKLSQYASDALAEDVKKIIELSGSAGKA